MTDIVVTGPDGSTFHFPQGTPADTITSAMGAHYGQTAQQPQARPDQTYHGMILPFTKDAQGNVSFDSNAGILGMLKRAVEGAESAATLPGDVYSGKTPITGPDGHTNQDVVNRSAELATMATPVAPGLRAGETLIPSAGNTLVKEKPPVPSATELKSAASAGYDAARNSGVNIPGAAVGKAARGLQSELEQDGIIAELAPKTFAILGKVTNPPDGSFATIANIQAIRRSLQRAAGDFQNPTEQLAATRAIRGIDRFLEGLGSETAMAGAASAEAGMPAISYGGMVPPQTGAEVAGILKTANGNYAAAQRSNALTGELDRATTGILERAENRAQAANSGRNLDNTIRSKVASLLEKPKEVSGFSDPELAALNSVLQGGPARNSARYVGNLLGGGGGLGQAITGGIGAAGGAAVGGGAGAAIGAIAPAATGALAKTIANALAKRSLGKADEIVRMNSPLYQDLLRNAPAVPQNLTRRAAIARALLAAALAQRQQ